MSARPAARGARVRSRRAGAGVRGNLLTNLVLILPLLILYQAGVLLTLPLLNGADLLTVLLFRGLGLGLGEYLAFLAVLALVFAGALARLRRTQPFDARAVIPILLESAIYAFATGTLIVVAMTRILGIDPRLGAGLAAEHWFSRLVLSLGAGVHEELVFRLGMLGGTTWLLQRGLAMRALAATLVALILSSLAFAAVHHLPPLGDPLTPGLFTFRTLAGVWFGLLYRLRGLAVTVYTHALYDVYVLLLR